MKLILLCGQGGVGKTTYGHNLVKKYQDNSILISMDQCLTHEDPWLERVAEYINQIQQAINIGYNYIFCDMSQSNEFGRMLTLYFLTEKQNIDLVILQLRPSLENIKHWITKNNKINIKSTIIKKIETIYNNFNPAIPEEFIKYDFKSVSIYIIDNANNICLSGDKNYKDWLI